MVWYQTHLFYAAVPTGRAFQKLPIHGICSGAYLCSRKRTILPTRSTMIGGPAVVPYGTYRAFWGVAQRQ